MKGKVFLAVFSLFALAVSPAWANQSASASAAQSQTAMVVSAPKLAPNASASSNQSTSVGVQANPTAAAGGGTGIGIGGQGGQGGSAVVVLDQSRGDTVSYNRQIPSAGGSLPIPVSGNFTRPWERGWNIVNIRPGTFRVNGLLETEELDAIYLRSHLDVKNLPRSSRVSLVGYVFDAFSNRMVYIPPTGRKVGDINIVLPGKYNIEDAKRFAIAWCAKHGADQAEVVSFGGRLAPTLRGSSRGLNGVGGGVLGYAEAMALSIAPKANETKSTTTNDAQPHLLVYAWYSGGKSISPVGISNIKKNGNGVQVPVAVKATN